MHIRSIESFWRERAMEEEGNRVRNRGRGERRETHDVRYAYAVGREGERRSRKQ